MSPRLLYFLSKTISYGDASELIQFAGEGVARVGSAQVKPAARLLSNRALVVPMHHHAIIVLLRTIVSSRAHRAVR